VRVLAGCDTTVLVCTIIHVNLRMHGVCYGLLTILALYPSWVLVPIGNGAVLVGVGVFLRCSCSCRLGGLAVTVR
jgi:hypothetical protein